MQKKQIAKLAGTEIYFSGTAFNTTRAGAKVLEGVNAEDFQLMWAAPVELVDVAETKTTDPYEAAKEFVRKCQVEFRQKSFTIRTAGGKYISRVVYSPKRKGDSAFIKFQGTEIGVRLLGGELSL